MKKQTLETTDKDKLSSSMLTEQATINAMNSPVKCKIISPVRASHNEKKKKNFKSKTKKTFFSFYAQHLLK